VEEVLPSGRIHKKTVPARVTVRKRDGRALIDVRTDSPVEIPYCTFAALVADKLVSFAGRYDTRGDVYRPSP